MLLTEEEAKKRWCPHVRVSNGPDGSWNRLTNSVTDHVSYDCIASECMAWRKRESAEFIIKADAEFKRSGARLQGTEGFCGLAVPPQ